MGNYLVHTCAILISAVLLIEWFELFFERKVSYKKMVILIIEYICIISFVVQFFFVYVLRLEATYKELLGSCFEFLMEWLLLMRQYKASLLKKITVYLICQIAIPIIEHYVFSIVNKNYFNVSSINDIYVTKINNFTLQIISYILIIVISETRRTRKYGKSNFYVLPFVFISIFQFGLHYVFETVFLVKVNNTNMNMYLLAYASSVVIFFCICIIYKKYINDMEHRRMEKERLGFYKLQYGHYHDTREHLNELKGIKHDFRKHMIVLKSLSQENRQEELDQYIDEMESQISLSTKIIDGKNSVISAQLTHVKELCRKNEIFFEYVLEYEDINIAPFDLNTILGNVLDNAVEASMQVEQKKLRHIQIIIQEQKGVVMIVCKNYFQGEIQENNSHILTSKKDTQKHGFGIQNICDTVKRYEGKVDIKTDNQEFYISVLFRNVSDKT